MYGTGAHLGQGCKVSDWRAAAGPDDDGGKRQTIVPGATLVTLFLADD